MNTIIKTKAIAGTGALYALLVLSTACTYEAFTHASDYDAVITVRIDDDTYDFAANGTYALLDEVHDLSDMVNDPIEVEHEYDETILAEIKTHMDAMGYVQVDDPQDPSVDLVVAAGIVAQNNWRYYGYYPWWGWDYWYIYYPPVVVPVNYASGSLIVTMVDPDLTTQGEDGEDVYQVVWAGGIHGLLNATTEEKIVYGIEQAFTQSPYLAEGGAQ